MAFLLAALLILCGLLSNIRLRFSLTIERERVSLALHERFFFRLIPLRLRVCLSYSPLRLYVGGKVKPLEFGRKEKVKVKKERPLLRALFRERALWLRAEELRIRGAVGSTEDACTAILWAGSLSILLDCAARVLLEPAFLQMRLLPVYGARCFCLNLEGIVTLRIWQIIGVAIRQQISSMRGKRLWRTPLKTS